MLLLTFNKGKALAEETEESAYRSGKFVDKKRFRLVTSMVQISFPVLESSSFFLGTGE